MNEPAAPDPEPPRLLAEYVYIDASSYRQAQFDWSGRALAGIEDLAKRNLIRVVVTEITRREVTALMRETWAEANRAMEQSKTILRQLGHHLVLDALADQDACVGRMNENFDAWLKACRVFVCKEAAHMPTVLDDYFAGRPQFGGGAKKAEFPDALVVSTLRKWAATFQKALYIVAGDGDLEKCCGPGTPFVFARTIREVVSHGTSSAGIHEAVLNAAKNSIWLSDRLGDDAAGLDVQIERGFVGGGRVEIGVRTVKLDSFDVSDVVIEALEGGVVSATVYAWCELQLKVLVEQEPAQDWDSGSRHEQRLTVSHELTAQVGANLGPDGDVDLFEARFNDRHVQIAWSEVQREIEVYD